jgi:triphosphoribosyl-dephospho-CoA synthetase
VDCQQAMRKNYNRGVVVVHKWLLFRNGCCSEVVAVHKWLLFRNAASGDEDWLDCRGAGDVLRIASIFDQVCERMIGVIDQRERESERSNNQLVRGCNSRWPLMVCCLLLPNTTILDTVRLGCIQ